MSSLASPLHNAIWLSSWTSTPFSSGGSPLPSIQPAGAPSCPFWSF